MTARRRYRLALLAYPAGYRATRGEELLATLADGDDARGRPSTREALALAYRGLLQRGGIALSGDGLLLIAAGLMVVALFFGLTWAEHWFLYGGQVGAIGTDQPATWAMVALTVAAFTVIAAGPGRAVEDARRRRIAAAIAFFAALLLWPAPGDFIKYSIPGPSELLDSLWGNVAAVYANREVAIPHAAATAAGTWLALLGLSRLPHRFRRPALAGALFAASTAAVVMSLSRPDIPEWGRSAFADLGAAAFVTAASALLALAASGRRGSNPY